MSLFTPVGEKSKRELVVDLFADKDYGHTVTYEELADLLNQDIRNGNRSAIYDAQKTLEKNHKKTIVVEQGVGYRVADPNEHIGLAISHQKRAKRQIRKSISKASATERSALTSSDQARLDLIETNLRRQQRELGRLDSKVSTVEKRVTTQEEETKKANSRYLAIVDALKSAGIEIKEES